MYYNKIVMVIIKDMKMDKCMMVIAKNNLWWNDDSDSDNHQSMTIDDNDGDSDSHESDNNNRS